MASCQSVILTFCDLKPCQVCLLRLFLSHFCFNRSIFTQCATREVCNHYKWWLGAQSLVQEPKLVPFLFPVSLGILDTLAVLIQRTILLLGSVSNSFSPHKDKQFGSIQFQVRAFVLYSRFILASAQLGAGGGSAELSLKVTSVIGAA